MQCDSSTARVRDDGQNVGLTSFAAETPATFSVVASPPGGGCLRPLAFHLFRKNMCADQISELRPIKNPSKKGWVVCQLISESFRKFLFLRSVSHASHPALTKLSSTFLRPAC